MEDGLVTCTVVWGFDVLLELHYLDHNNNTLWRKKIRRKDETIAKVVETIFLMLEMRWAFQNW